MALAQARRPGRAVSTISATTTVIRAAADTSHIHAGTVMDHTPAGVLPARQRKLRADSHRDPQSSSAGRRRVLPGQVKIIWPPAASALNKPTVTMPATAR